MTTLPKKIALALSGGGIRATVFHMGALACLAETDLWSGVTHISTVSGGSLCAGRLFSLSGLRWPTAEQFLDDLSSTFKLLTRYDLQQAYVFGSLLKPWRLLQGRAYIVARLLQEKWGISGCISELPESPRWHISSTCYESGKSWRFSKKRMGDYIANYVEAPFFPISSAIASSAAVPGLIGPLKISTKKYAWKKFQGSTLVDASPIAKTLTIWDGGVYDNLGTESLYKIGQGPREGIDFLLICDASAPLPVVKRTWIGKLPIIGLNVGKRLIDIPTDQARSVRARELFHSFKERGHGGYLRIGETVKEIADSLGCSQISQTDIDSALGKSETSKAARFDTTLRKLQPDEFRLLFRHGYETCSAVLTGTIGIEYTLFPMNKFPFQRINNYRLRSNTSNQEVSGGFRI